MAPSKNKKKMRRSKKTKKGRRTNNKRRSKVIPKGRSGYVKETNMTVYKTVHKGKGKAKRGQVKTYTKVTKTVTTAGRSKVRGQKEQWNTITKRLVKKQGH